MTNIVEGYISRQLKYWQSQRVALNKDEEEAVEEKLNPFVSISREYGCGGFEIASIISEMLNDEYKAEPVWGAYDQNILEKLSDDMGFSKDLAETLTSNARNQIAELFSYAFSNLPSQLMVYKKLAEIIRTLATKGNVIIVGRGANIITQDMKNGLQVKMVAPFEWRVDRVSKLFKMGKDDAKKMIMEKTKTRRSVFNEIIKYDVMNPNHYHMVINNSRCNSEESARLIIQTMKIKGLLEESGV